MSSFCTHCGTALPPGARFCSNCGTAVTGSPFAGPRPLFRPIAGRVCAGVCIGLSQAYGWDLTAVRLLTVIGFAFTGGLVGIAYIACWAGIPEEPISFPGAVPPPYA